MKCFVLLIFANLFKLVSEREFHSYNKKGKYYSYKRQQKSENTIDNISRLNTYSFAKRVRYHVKDKSSSFSR